MALHTKCNLAGQLKLSWVQVLSAGDPGWATGAEAGAGGGVPGALRRGALAG